jgi:protein-tyrosine phosphatase
MEIKMNDLSAKHLVFVCTINRHRSVIAEFLFRQMLITRDRSMASGISVSSTGIVNPEQKSLHREKGIAIPRPMFGWRPMPCVVFYMQKKVGIDVTEHRSRPLDSKTVKRSHFIVAMGESHKQSICGAYPAAADKVATLADLSFPFQFDDIVADEPPGLMPPAKFCMLECDHWSVTDRVTDQIQERLTAAMPEILIRLGREPVLWEKSRSGRP